MSNDSKHQPKDVVSSVLTVTVGFFPEILHVAEEHVNQHQPVAAHQAVPAALITRTHLRTQRRKR